PVSIMESLCFGIPVLATAVGGIPELVDPTVGALLPENTGADSFGEAIAAILMRSRDIELRCACRKRWEERCQAKRNYSDFADSLLSLFTKRG
ncbi:MAG: glycosyltransferase, partial [Rectinemataceae bacterium]